MIPMLNVTPDEDNIIVSWQEGKVTSSINEKLRAKSKSTGLQHAMGILGESTYSANNTSQHSSVKERALDKKFRAKLPHSIDPVKFSEPTQPPPQNWSKSSTSEFTPPTTTTATNNCNDQQSIKMILPPSRNDLNCVAMTDNLDNTGPTGSKQFEQQVFDNTGPTQSEQFKRKDFPPFCS